MTVEHRGGFRSEAAAPVRPAQVLRPVGHGGADLHRLQALGPQRCADRGRVEGRPDRLAGAGMVEAEGERRAGGKAGAVRAQGDAGLGQPAQIAQRRGARVGRLGRLGRVAHAARPGRSREAAARAGGNSPVALVSRPCASVMRTSRSHASNSGAGGRPRVSRAKTASWWDSDW